VGSVLDGVGVWLAEVDGDGVAAGESLGPGDVVGRWLDAGVPATVEVQLASATASVAAQQRANRRGIVLQRGTRRSRALRRRAMMRSRHMTYAQSETANSVRTTLGALLRQRRDEAERSLAEVAASAGLSAAYLSEVERGLKDISTEKLIALTTALELSAADLYLNLARQLGSREAIQQQRSWPDDPRMQLRIATASLRPHALRSVADFSLYLAATQATPPRRRIGFIVDR
jgi:transcriptional regulator with XRE-family HTH domain